MSKGQFYYYFKTKEELISEVIDKSPKDFYDTVENVAKEKNFFVINYYLYFHFT